MHGHFRRVGRQLEIFDRPAPPDDKAVGFKLAVRRARDRAVFDCPIRRVAFPTRQMVIYFKALYINLANRSFRRFIADCIR